MIFRLGESLRVCASPPCQVDFLRFEDMPEVSFSPSDFFSASIRSINLPLADCRGPTKELMIPPKPLAIFN